MRALTIGMRRPVSAKAQALADAEALRLGEHRRAEGDVGERQAAVPEEVGLVVALASWLQPGDDLAKLGVQVLLREAAAVDMRAQRAVRARFRLAPVVH